MLMFAGKVHDLRHFGFGDLVSEHPAFADAVLVHMHHDAMGRLGILVEETLEHVDDEFHGRVVVVEQQHAIEVRTLGLRLGLGNDRGAGAGRIAFALAIVVRHAERVEREHCIIRRHSVVYLPEGLSSEPVPKAPVTADFRSWTTAGTSAPPAIPSVPYNMVEAVGVPGR